MTYAAFSGFGAWIFGRGAHGRVVEETMQDCGVEALGFIDDASPETQRPEDVIREHPGAAVYVAIGSPPKRAAITRRLKAMGFSVAQALVSPYAYVAPSVGLDGLGAGTIVLPGAIIHTHARLGEGVLVNLQAVIHHDAVVEDYVTVSPQAQVCGRCFVGRGALVAVRACLMFPHELGENAILGADSVAHEDIPDNELWIGSPAKKRRDVDEETWRRCF